MDLFGNEYNNTILYILANIANFERDNGYDEDNYYFEEEEN